MQKAKLTKKKLELSIEEIRHIADLANLTLTGEEIRKFQVQLSEVLNYVGQLSQLDTSGIEPTSQVTSLENIFREDEIRPSLTENETLSGARNKINGFFNVEAIFK